MTTTLRNTLYTLCTACLLSACGADYSCHCYLHGKADTTADYGGIKSDEAHKRCDAMQDTRPQDSCGVEGIGYH